jgi:type IV pilus assembly protein PilM
VGPLRGVLGFLRGPLGFSGGPSASDARLSVDIGSSAVKIVEAHAVNGSLRISKVGYAALPPTAVQNNMVQEPDRVTAAILGILDRLHPSTQSAVTVVPGPTVIVKKVVLPVQRDQDLESAVLVEASHLIPDSLDNVNLDFQVVDWLEDGRKAEVLVVAAKKEIINSYADVLRAAGLEAAVVDVDHFALENMFELNYEAPPGKAVALVNVGARYTSINILKDGRSTFTGDVPAGGSEFNDVLVRQLGVSFAEAELLKSGGRVRDLGPEQIEPLVGSVIDFLVEEIQRALSFFWTAATEEPLAAIYLSGGAAAISGLVPQLSQRLEAPVELVDPFHRLTVDASVDRRLIAQHGPALAVCVGLATRQPGDK